MREQKRVKTIEEVTGYIADDGTFFTTKEECQNYEKSAKVVVYNMVKEKMIAETSEYEIFDIGCEDHIIEVFLVDSVETMELLNRYTYLYSYTKPEKNYITEEMIGKEIMMTWGYVRDYVYNIGSIGDFLVDCRRRFENIIASKKQNSQ